jgi:hypothetical protein
MTNIKKPSKVSGSKKRPRPTRFYALVFSVILVFGLFNGFLVKNALALNNSDFIDNVVFYNDAYNSNKTIFKFHVKASFSYTSTYYNERGCEYCYEGNAISDYPLYLPSTTDNGVLISLGFNCGDVDFIAGHTYTIQLVNHGRINICGGWNLYGYWRAGDSVVSNYSGDLYLNWPASYDTEPYHITEFPTANIIWPTDNAELTGAFNIQGSYTIPAGIYNKLYASFEPTLSGFYQNISGTSGDVLIPVNDIPAGSYQITFTFFGELTAYKIPLTLNIVLVNDIPPALPETGETPPEVPIYPPTAPDTYHTDYCAYGTSTTPLFNTLTGAVSGMITSIGDNLATFAGRFSNTDAKDTGEQLASSVLTMRAYVAGLNSFFGELPVGEILVLYLIIFVLVILFRVIKGLINLIKP